MWKGGGVIGGEVVVYKLFKIVPTVNSRGLLMLWNIHESHEIPPHGLTLLKAKLTKLTVDEDEVEETEEEEDG